MSTDFVTILKKKALPPHKKNRTANGRPRKVTNVERLMKNPSRLMLQHHSIAFRQDEIWWNFM